MKKIHMHFTIIIHTKISQIKTSDFIDWVTKMNIAYNSENFNITGMYSSVTIHSKQVLNIKFEKF